MTSDKAEQIRVAVVLLRANGFRHTETFSPFANETGRLDYGMRFSKVGAYAVASLNASDELWLNDRTVDMILLLLS